jgi:hypothetical protein
VISDHIAELTHSPMFRLMVQGYKDGLERDSVKDDPGFHLAAFAARAFLAGTLYAGLSGSMSAALQSPHP